MFSLDSLEVYKLAKELSNVAWNIYETLDWHNKKNIGDQFIQSTDSVGANIAEGYGRYHYLDRIKFLYNSRGSLLESKHWFDLLIERKLISDQIYQKNYISTFTKLKPSLNAFINSIYKNRASPPNP